MCYYNRREKGGQVGLVKKYKNSTIQKFMQTTLFELYLFCRFKLHKCWSYNFGVDAWNTVIVRLADLTPITLGTWTVLLQGSFWIITSVFNRKVEMDCILPIIWKGLSLDVAKAVIGARLFNNLTGMCFLWFLIGYAIMGISTGIYIATDYPRMPIDGMMLAIKQVFSLDIKKSRLIIEAVGFITMFLVGGKIQIGTIIITFTVSYVVSFSHGFAEIKFKRFKN